MEPVELEPNGGMDCVDGLPWHNGVAFAMARGDLLVVRYLIQRDGIETCASAVLPGLLASFLEEAGDYEDANGEGSFLRPDDRFNCELLPYLDRQAKGEVLELADVPAPMWSKDRGWHWDTSTRR